jgi:hypothetical protein
MVPAITPQMEGGTLSCAPSAHAVAGNDVFTSTTRQAFRTAVDQVAANARASLPECASRIDKAVAIVLQGDVELLPDGHARVASQCQGTLQYRVVNGTCDCRDFPQAPSGWCKHRIAAGIQKRALAMVTHWETRRLGDAGREGDAGGLGDTATRRRGDAGRDSGVPSLPRVAASGFVAASSPLPSAFVTTIHGRDFVQFAGLLALAHAQGLVSLSAELLSVTPELAVARATATFADGRTFTEAADATPDNVNAGVRKHFARCALTRAKSRALRDALNINMVAVEELE